MKYAIGNIGSAEGMALIIMLLLPNVYMLEPCMGVRYAGNNAWLMKLLGGLLALGFLWVKFRCYRSYAKKYADGSAPAFGVFLSSILGKNGAALFFFAWSLLFFGQTAIMLRQLADNTIMMALPSLPLPLLVFFFSVCAYFLSLRGLEVLLRSAYIFFFLSALGIVILMIGLLPNYNVLELFPLQGHGIANTLWYACMDSGTWISGAAIFAVASNLQNVHTLQRSLCWGFGYTLCLKTLLLACLLMIFGSVVATERTLLFYEAMRTFHFSQYIQRVDAAFIFIWLTGGVVSITLSMYFAVGFWTEAFSLPDARPLLPLGAVAISSLALLPQGIMETFRIDRFFLYDVGAWMFFADFLIVSAAYYLFQRRKKPCRT